LTEKSILSYPDDTHRERDLWRGYTQLSPAEQTIVRSLHGGNIGGTFDAEQLAHISALNAWGRYNGGGLIFPEISRINHACDANADYHYHFTLDAGVIHAIKDIKSNEEIFICYLNEDDATLRHEELANRYGFHCECAFCTDVSDVERRALTYFASPFADDWVAELPAEEQLEFYLQKLRVIGHRLVSPNFM